jgi:signal transduction histidine kinase
VTSDARAANEASADGPLGSARFDPVLQPVVQAAALRGERIVSISRVVFCTLVLVRFLMLEQSTSAAPYLLNFSALGSAIGYSLWLLARMRQGRATYRMLAVSVAIDSVGAFASLLQTVLWPAQGAQFRGLLTTPDMAALLLIVYCAGFRVWPRLAVLGAVLNLISYVALVVTELTIARPGLAYGVPEVMMFLFVLVSVIVLSVGTAMRTLELLAAGASATRQVERARRKLAELVREHHDARSAISAAALSSDMMVRALQDEVGPARGEDGVRRHAERLREDLEEASKQLAELGEKTYLQLTTLGEIERVETGRVLREAVNSLRLKFPDLTVETELTRAADLMVVGGAASIQRILYNLVSNAREGDGRSGALHVSVRAESDGNQVKLVVEDDGPGFGESVLPAAGTTPATTKPDGMGLGLLMTSELVRISGGSLTTDNRPDGGGRLCVTLPAATAEAR